MQGSISFDGTLAGSIAGGGGGGAPQDVYWDDILDKPNFAEVATSGSYNDLSDKPTIINYTAGDNIDITNGVISATDTTYTAGTGININNGVISATGETESQPIFFDFTKNIIDKNHFVCPISSTKNVNNGLSFNAASDYFELDKYLFGENMVYEIGISSLSIQDTSRQNVLFRFVSDNLNGGFAYHYQTGKWAVWDRTTGWQDSTISNKDYFNNSVVKIIIDGLGKWHIYKDGVLIFEPVTALETTTTGFGLGSPTACITNITINSFKIYPYTA